MIDSKKFRFILLGVFGLCVIGFLALGAVGLSTLSTKSKAMVDLKLKNQTADAQLTNLQSSKKQIEKYSYFKDIAKTVIPSDKDQATAVLEIYRIASQSGITLQSVTFPSSNLGSTLSTLPPASGSSGSSATTPPANHAISQAVPVTGIPGLYSVQVNITPATGLQVPDDQQVTYQKMLDFLSRIESNRRTAQITQVNIQPLSGADKSGGQINFTLTVNIFIKP